jgi:hypothetical protein
VGPTRLAPVPVHSASSFACRSGALFLYLVRLCSSLRSGSRPSLSNVSATQPGARATGRAADPVEHASAADGRALSTQAAGRPPSALQRGHHDHSADAEYAAADGWTTGRRRGELTRSPDQTASCLCTTRAGWALAHAVIARERREGIENGAASNGAVRRETSPARHVLSCCRRHSMFRSRLSCAVACSPFSSSLALSPRTDLYSVMAQVATRTPRSTQNVLPRPSFSSVSCSIPSSARTRQSQTSSVCSKKSHSDYTCTVVTALQLCAVFSPQCKPC